MPTQEKHSSRIRSIRQINSLAYKLTKAQQLTNASLVNSQAHQPTNAQNLNPLLLFYSTTLISTPF